MSRDARDAEGAAEHTNIKLRKFIVAGHWIELVSQVGESDYVRISTVYFAWGRAIIQMIIYVFFYVCYFLVVRP